MNDRYDATYGGDQQYELVGYDEYGQPVYRQAPAQQVPQQQAYDPYGTQAPQGYGQGYGYDPYATGHAQQQHTQGYGTGYDTGQQAPGPAYDPYDPYGQTAVTGRQAPVAEQTAYIPQQSAPPQTTEESGPRPGDAFPEQDPAERDYRTEQFAFVEDPDGDSEDVIDWLNFTENRTERREEAKRRAKSRMIALVVALALVAVGGVGYMGWAGMLPGSPSDGQTGTTTSAAAQKRDVVVVHLHDTRKGGTSTALLVNNATTEQGATVLIPNALALTGDDGTTTTLAKSVDDDGSSGTRDALDTVLGTDIEGTWRLDTPYLNNLVGLVGNIDVDTNTDVPDPEAEKKGAAPLVTKGKQQTLSGKMAVAYATYRASGESQDAQLERFGQVMQGVLRKLSSDAQAATVTVQTLAQILDPRSATRTSARSSPSSPTTPRAATTSPSCCPSSRTAPSAPRTPTVWSRTCSAAPRRAPTPGTPSGSASATPPARRTPPNRPAWSSSTAATPSSTRAPPPPPRPPPGSPTPTRPANRTPSRSPRPSASRPAP